MKNTEKQLLLKDESINTILTKDPTTMKFERNVLSQQKKLLMDATAVLI